jgi:glycosyltransferase involved in cell wall biosynthesis
VGRQAPAAHDPDRLREAWLVAIAGDTAGPGLRILVTVTFGANQLRSHLLPLVALPEVESITLVSDVEPPPLSKLRSVVPSSRRQRVLTRAGSKLALCLSLARRERFDWVIGFNLVPHGFNAQLVGRRTGTRSMYHMIGGELEWLGGGYRSDNRVLSRLPRPAQPLEAAMLRQARQASVVATMGPAGRETLVARGFDPRRVHVIPPSADLDRFRGVGRGTAYDLVTVGQLNGRKRTADLLQAVALLGRRGRTVRAAIAGQGPLLAELQALARSLGIADQIDFLGHVDKIEDVYASARAFVLTSAFEGLPSAMLDAMASGLPVVSSAVGEIGRVIESGRNGLLYEAGDVDALAGQIERVLDAPEEAARFAAEARAAVEREYSVDRVALVYRDVLSKS